MDLYSTEPTPYNIEIKVNNIVIGKYFDTVIYFTSGLSAQTFDIMSQSCTLRITYDGPIYSIYLFAPGVSVLDGSFKYS